MSFSYNIIDKIFNKIATLADQEEALKDPWLAYEFARLNIPGTNIEKCQEIACKSQYYAYNFAYDIPGANIEYCRKVCESDHVWLKDFDKMIVGKIMR